jgi:GT2 family glycosyltransferase
MNIPILFTTFNRIEYSKKALDALMQSDCGDIYIFDNCSTDGTIEWLESMIVNPKLKVYFSETNVGVAGAMNHFIDEVSADYGFAGKVDNDTVVPKNWCALLYSKMNAKDIDIIQAKHPIIEDTFRGANFDEWTKTMLRDEKDESIFYSAFVGGSGVLFKTKKIGKIKAHETMLSGWTEYQIGNIQLSKAFCTAVDIELLDMKKEGGENYADKEYYKQTGRI